jgi:DNA-binding transcriptional LysR family regulator
MDRLLSMRVFQRVIDEGGFAAAARALDMSPAMVTRLVNDLESHLGARLLQRTTRSLALTDAGHAYVLRLRHILSEVDEANAVANASSGDLQGSLHILATPLLATNFIAPRAAAWRVRHPKLRLDIAVDHNPAPRIEEFDLSFLVLEDGNDANIVARALVRSEWVVCCAPSYVQHIGLPKQPVDLTSWDYLRFMAPGAFAQHGKSLHLKHTAQAAPPTDVTPHAAIHSESMDLILRATLEGAGFAVLSKILVAPYLARGELVHLLPEWSLGAITVYAAMPSRKFIPARSRAFLDFLDEYKLGQSQKSKAKTETKSSSVKTKVS